VNFFNSHWERVRLQLTPTNIRVIMVIMSIAAMALGGAGRGFLGLADRLANQLAGFIQMVGMLLPVVVVAAAVALWTGSTAGLRRLRIDWWPLALASMGVQLIIHNPPWNQQPWALAWGQEIWMLCLTAMLAVLIRNALNRTPAQHGWQVAALGVGLNLLVVVANGGYMPQSPEARLAARGSAMGANAHSVQLYNVTPIDKNARLVWLSDVIPQPSWMPRANVISVGDVLLAVGLALLAGASIVAGRPQVRRRTADA
jgi:hypothetical protein